MTDFIELLFKRRSIRKFTDQPVERETLVTLMKAAMSGPSASNARPWEFVIITDPETINKLRNNLMFAKMHAPVVICVLGSQRRQANRSGDLFWQQDCAAATENILLAAVALGLGAVWVGVHPVKMFEMPVKRILNLPSGVRPLNLIFLGYPAEEKEPRTQYDETRVHWGAFPKTGKEKDEEEPKEEEA